jgi:hypothetical protein
MIAACFLTAWCYTVYATVIDSHGMREVQQQYEFDNLDGCLLFKEMHEPLIGRPIRGHDILPSYPGGMQTVVIHDDACSHPGRF